MKIIEKIEIKHFRSFLGTPQKYQTVVDNLTDLNIFSGSNDSGKSNILRVLNVFFNNEISHGIPFDFERDFFLGKRSAGHRVVEISVTFDLSHDIKRDKFLPDKFKISKFYDREGFRNYLYSFILKEKPEVGEIHVDSRSENNDHVNEIFQTDNQENNAKQREWVYRVKFAGFLNKSIGFEYVPAIRDKNFFSQLFGRVITRIKYNEDKRILDLQREKNKIINWSKTVKNKTEKKDFKENIQDSKWRRQRLEQIDFMSAKEGKLASTISSLESEINDYSKSLISSISFIDSEFKIGKNLQDFFEGFDVGTGDGKAISLSLRGDGVQAKFVPKILNFLSHIDEEKKYFIWGFEEPENSAEYKNQQELAKEFKGTFCKDKQIFITTHSEEFLQLYDDAEIDKKARHANLYHVKKLQDKELGDYSQIFYFDVDKNEFDFTNQKSLLDQDLGQSYLRAKYAKELKELEETFLREKVEIQKENANLRSIVNQNNKAILKIEDSYAQLYKIAWLKLNGFSISVKSVEQLFDKEAPFAIFSAEGASALAGFLRMKNIDFWSHRKLVGLFDFDEAGVEQFKCLKNCSYWNGQILGDRTNGIHKKRNDHPHFFALLIPIPSTLSHLASIEFPSFIEIENLLPDAFLLENKFAEKKITTGNTEYLKIIDSKKSKVWEKAINLNVEDFENFKPLFLKIYDLLALA